MFFIFRRLTIALGLFAGLRRHDFRAARTFVNAKFAGQPWIVRWSRFLAWSLHQVFSVIPDAMRDMTFSPAVSPTPIWLAEGNPLANHPWSGDAQVKLPQQVNTVVIGAGFTGAAMAYHWSKVAQAGQTLVVLEMDDPASGSSGRNEGLVVMGRYYAYVYKTVLLYLERVRGDLTKPDREQLARQFAAVYCNSAYKNADMIEQTIQTEGFDCDYSRQGWVQAADDAGQIALKESVQMALDSGYTDWTSITPEEVLEKTGMRVSCNSGFSIAAASFHPAKWVWSLLGVALKSPSVELFTRTKVERVEDAGQRYLIHTSRGVVEAQSVVNATESYTPQLHRRMHDVIQPTQTQAASGIGGPKEVKPHIGISGSWFFCGRHDDRFMIGSDATRVPDREAGRIQPSRFLTKYLLGEIKRAFGRFELHLTHQWSGAVGYTPDEFPVVGLMDDRRQYVIGGMAGSGTAVSFNAARCISNRILQVDAETDDYPPEYFAPSRLIDPKRHSWPEIQSPIIRPNKILRRKT
ncbi:MAG: FAD-dependent oxidoreductase [Pirellulales bacterium]